MTQLGARERRMLIVRAMADRYDVTVEEIFSDSRHPRVCEARWRAMLMMRVALRDSMVKLGQFFGKDHTSVMHGLCRTLGAAPKRRGQRRCMAPVIQAGVAACEDRIRAEVESLFETEITRREQAVMVAEFVESAHAA